MSTPNFSCKNADAIYARHTDNDWFWEDLQEEVKDIIHNEHTTWSTDDGWDDDRYRSMSYLMERNYPLVFAGSTFTVNARIGCRCGYYDGANFDFDLKLIDEQDGYNEGDLDGDSTDTLVDNFIHYIDHDNQGWNAGFFKMNKKHLRKRLIDLCDKVVEECNAICKELCTDELDSICMCD